MITLGINISHDFSVCVYENGKIKDFFYEERYNFKKRWKIKNKNCFLLSLFKNINFKPDLVIYSSIQRLNNASISDEEVIHDIQKQLDIVIHIGFKHYLILQDKERYKKIENIH